LNPDRLSNKQESLPYRPSGLNNAGKLNNSCLIEQHEMCNIKNKPICQQTNNFHLGNKI